MPEHFLIKDWKHPFARQLIRTERKFLFWEMLRIHENHIIELIKEFGFAGKCSNRIEAIQLLIEFYHQEAMKVLNKENIDKSKVSSNGVAN